MSATRTARTNSPSVPTRAGTRGARALTVAAAAAAALVVWALISYVFGVDLAARPFGAPDYTPVGAAAVVAGGLVPGLCAWGLLALMERLGWRARRVWTIVAGVVLVLSLATPLTGGETLGAVIGLTALHLTVAAVLIPGLARTAVR
ncbi:DUF6069 family protein [Actinopolymorpha pittospori]